MLAKGLTSNGQYKLYIMGFKIFLREHKIKWVGAEVKLRDGKGMNMIKIH